MTREEHDNALFLKHTFTFLPDPFPTDQHRNGDQNR